MPLKVLYLPGFLGSELSWSNGPGAAPTLVWPDLARLLAGALVALDLDADGVSPGPLAEGKVIVASEILVPAYGPLAAFMRSVGWDLWVQPWDWRQSFVTQARVVLAAIADWLGQSPLYIVAHSQGGLLARALYGVLADQHRDGQLARLLTLGTPHYGSFETFLLLWRQQSLYQVISAALGWTHGLPGLAGPAYLDQVLASWTCVYELLPHDGDGPLFESDPAQARSLYDLATYERANPYMDGSDLLSAQLVQGELAGWLPADRMVSIAGAGFDTVYQLVNGQSYLKPESYLRTPDGDGIVTVAEAAPAGVPLVTVPVDHLNLLLDWRVWRLVWALLPAGP